MKLEPKTKNTISLVGFILGLSGIIYTLWLLMMESDLQAIPLLVQSITFVVGAYYFLIKDNAQYPPGIDVIVRNITFFLVCLWFMSLSVFRQVTGANASFFAGLTIFIIVLFSATTFVNLWGKRIKCPVEKRIRQV